MLEVNNVCVSFRSERQEKIFGTARNQVLFDVSLKVSGNTGRIRKWEIYPWPCDLWSFKA